MCKTTSPFAAALAMAGLVGMGCATPSGTGIKVVGNQDAQTAFIQADLMEVQEEVEESGWKSAAMVPVNLVKENPGKALSALAAGLGYLLYDEYEDKGRDRSFSGVTQEGNNNTATFRDGANCPDVRQIGEGNSFECDIDTGSRESVLP